MTTVTTAGRLKFSSLIRYDDFTVRDHQVHGVRTLPGATYLDLLYRYLQTKGVDTQAITVQLLFTQPLRMDGGDDRKLVITLDPFEGGWRIQGESFRVKNGQRLDTAAVDHFRGEIRREARRISPQRLDIAGLKERAIKISDVAEVYARHSPMGLTHYEGMRLLGCGYHGPDYLLAEVRLGRLAAGYSDQFFIHPALLDGAFVIPGTLLAGDSFTAENIYLPFYLDAFSVWQKIQDPCYLYVHEDDVSMAPSQDVTHVNISIYRADGTLAASIQKFSARRLRLGGAGDPPPSPVAPEPLSVWTGARQEEIERDLCRLVGGILGLPAEAVNVEGDYYSQGLDSRHLLQLAEDLETKMGQKLYPTLLFEYPNIRKLAAYLAEHAGAAQVKQEAAAASLVGSGEERPAAAALEPLTIANEGLAIVGMTQGMADASFGDYLQAYTTQDHKRHLTPMDMSRPYFLLASKAAPTIFHLLLQPEPGEVLEAFVGGSGRPILLLSGFGTTVLQWREQMVPLSRQYQAIALHAPGHGYSVGSPDLTLSGVARSFVKALERLAIDWPIHIVGASWGGMVAQAMAWEFPERVASLTLAGSMSNATTLSSADLRERILTDLATTGSLQYQDIVLGSRFINADLRKYRGDEFSTDAILSEVTTPTLVIAGERDTVVGTEEAKQLSARIPGAQYGEIADAGHVPYLTHAEEFNRLVLAFIAAQEVHVATKDRR